MKTLIRISVKTLFPTMVLCAAVLACDRRPDSAPAPDLAGTFRDNSSFCTAYDGQTVIIQRVTQQGEFYLYEVGDVVGVSAMPPPDAGSMHWDVHCEEGGVSFENFATGESLLASPPGKDVFLGDPSAWSLWTVLLDPTANPQDQSALVRFYHRTDGPNARDGYMTERDGWLHMTEDCGAASVFRVSVPGSQ